MEKTLNYLKKELNSKSVVVLACSTGPDSMCLCHLLMSLKKELEFKLIIAHMNHKVRLQSEEEKDYLKDFCEDNNLTFEYYELNKTIKSNFHSEARIIRYKFLEEVVHKYNATHLMTAHHSDDLMETILMRLGRGSNLKGYAGFEIKTKKDNYYLMKPLIFYTKQEIKDYMDHNNHKYYLDETNDTDDYLRNRYRHNILPLLKEENKNINERYQKFSNLLLETDKFLEDYTNKKIKTMYKDNFLDLDLFKKEEELIQKRILETLLSYLYIDNLYLVQDSNITEIIKTIYSKKQNISIKLPDNHNLTKEYNKLIVDKQKVINSIKKDSKYFYEDNYSYIEEVESSDDTSNYTIRLNTDELSLPLKIGYKKERDKIKVKNMTNYKKVKDVLINSKIPEDKRIILPILYDNNNEVIWLPGIKKSNYDKKPSEKFNKIFVYYEKK